MYVPNLN